jgi:hypothetical protein
MMAQMIPQKLLLKIFDKCPLLQEEIIIYRGIEEDYIYNFEFSEGDEKFTFNPNFTSGSLSYEYAIKYAGKPCCLLIIIIPKGSQILLLQGTTFYTMECEVVLPANSIFEIIDDYTLEDRRYITLEYEPQPINYIK